MRFAITLATKLRGIGCLLGSLACDFRALYRQLTNYTSKAQGQPSRYGVPFSVVTESPSLKWHPNAWTLVLYNLYTEWSTTDRRSAPSWSEELTPRAPWSLPQSRAAILGTSGRELPATRALALLHPELPTRRL